MPTVIKGQPTSADIISRLAAEGRPVALACSLGKDSLACWVALEEAGIDVRPVHFYSIPHLPMVDDEVRHFESVFGRKIWQYPHPRLAKALRQMQDQTPDRWRVVLALGLDAPSYDDLWVMAKEDMGLAQDTWVCDGVRACDSIQRRASLTKHGVIKKSKHKCSPIADWTKAEVMGALERRGIGLPPDYEMFGRSFDGYDARFMAKLRECRPDDFEIVKKWFPLISEDEKRWTHYGL